MKSFEIISLRNEVIFIYYYNQSPNANGEVTVNASQIDTVNTYKIGSDQSATTHTVDEVLAAGVYFEEATGFTNIDDVSL